MSVDLTTVLKAAFQVGFIKAVTLLAEDNPEMLHACSAIVNKMQEATDKNYPANKEDKKDE